MVSEQLVARGIDDQRVLDAMLAVPRHEFVPEEHRQFGYADGPLPIGAGQTISQPYVVALMSQTLALQGYEKVLEVGTGSGYQAAVLSMLAGQVFTIELHAEIGARAEKILRALAYANIICQVGDGSQGLPDEAPFDAILVTAAAPEVPLPLKSQLQPGGKIVLPSGGQQGQILECWQYADGKTWHEKKIAAVAFVPLRGKYGWDEAHWQ